MRKKKFDKIIDELQKEALVDEMYVYDVKRVHQILRKYLLDDKKKKKGM